MSEKEWIVPVNITVSTDCIVEAESASEARDKANRKDWVEDFRAQGEAIDWDVVGEPQPNE